MFKRALLSLFLLTGLAGCAVAPLSDHTTARTNGKNESMASLGSTIGVHDSGWLPSLKYSLGVGEDWDLGFQYEVIEWGVWAKYAFVNCHGDGFSFAGLAGAGLGFEGAYGYLGPIVSYKIGWFEPYASTRFNYVSNGTGQVDLANTGEFRVPPGTYRYLQHTVGFLAWPLHWFGVGLEASAFTTIRSQFILDGKAKYLASGNFSFRF